MTSVLILLAGFDPGTYFVEDDGIPNNGIAQLRGPDGNIILFSIPTEFLTITASAGRSIVFNLTESFGAADINVGNLTNAAENPDFIQVRSIAGAGDVLLVANQTITEIGADAAPDIVAGSLILSAGTGVGVPFNPIETQVGTIEAETDTGGIAITNFGTVAIGGLTDEVDGFDVFTSGNIAFTNFGTILLSDVSALGDVGASSIHGGSTSGNVTLIANGVDSDILSNVDLAAIRAERGDVTLTAGRDVAMGIIGANFNNDIIANGNLNLNAGRDLVVDGFSDLTSDSFGLGTGGDVNVNVGRDVNIIAVAGNSASLGASGNADGNVNINTGPGGTLNLSALGSTALFSNSGDIVIAADRMLIDGTSGMTVFNGNITIRPVTEGREIDLGSAADAAFALELSDVELNRIFTNGNSLTLGSDATGNINVTAAVSPTNAAQLTLRSGTDINVGAAMTVTSLLSLRAGDNVFLTPSTINVPTFLAFADQLGNDGGTGGIINVNALVSSTTAILTGNAEADTIIGTSANETLVGNGGNDLLRGNGGADTLNGGIGLDTMEGGLGNDLYQIDGSGDVVIEAVGEGTDTVVTPGTYTLAAGSEVENLITSAPSGTTGINLTGNEFNNNIQGNNGINLLVGGDGSDILLGFGGNDTLIGGIGTDTTNGGAGDDNHFVDSASDQAIEIAGQGTLDSVITTVSYALSNAFNVERLFTTNAAGTDTINLTGNLLDNNIQGNAGDNILTGNNGNDILLGFAGTDTLNGGAGIDNMNGGPGDDNFVVDNLDDIIVEAVGEGTDSVITSISYFLRPGFEVERLFTTNAAGTDPINLTGNPLNNNIQGNAGINVINGGLGSDLLVGNGGDDIFQFSTALGPTNVDTIVDFIPGDDRIALENAVFTGLAAGALPAGAFRSGAAAADADDRIIYNPVNGELRFDVDGVGGAASVLFAVLDAGLVLSSTDFAVF